MSARQKDDWYPTPPAGLAMMHHIDLCSGIGGFSLGFQQAGLSKPVLFCDTDAWCRKVLAKHWPDVPIAEDVKELANEPDRLIPRTDPRNTILTAGYPCQPFSQAGARRGTSDSRHIYPYISEIIAYKRPAWVVLENVYGHLSLGLDEVLNDLANQDYAARPFIFPSGAIVGAPHHRKRVWIIARNVGNAAHNGRDGWAAQAGREGQAHQPDQPRPSIRGEPIRPSEDVADTDCDRRQQMPNGQLGEISRSGEQIHEQERHSDSAQEASVFNADSVRCEGRASQQISRLREESRQFVGTSENRPHIGSVKPSICGISNGLSEGLDRFDGWEREPEDIPRVATGVKDRVNRLKGLGNAIVPQIAQRIGETIKKADGL